MNNFWDNRRGEVTEAQDYLRATDNVSRPMALLLSLVGFLVVFAVVFSLFLGGRWLFNRLSNDTDSTDVEQVAVIEGEQEIVNEGAANNGSVDNSAVLEQNLDAIDERLQNGPPATVDGEDTTTTTPDVSTTIVAGEAVVPDVEQLPRTGPGSTLVGFVAIAFLATVAHNKLASSKQ